MNILIIADPHIPIPPDNYGGTERIVSLLCEQLQSRDHTVYLLAGKGSTTYSGQTFIHYAPTLNYLSRAHRKIRFQFQSLWAICNVDAVVNFGRIDYLWSLLRTPVPLVCCFQNSIPQADINWLLTHRHRRIGLVGISHAQIASLSQANRFQIIYNAIDVARYTFQPLPATLPYLVFLGRMNRNKGIDIAIRVALKAGLPLRIAGNLPNEEGAQEFFNTEVAPYLNNTIQWLGPVNDKQKNDLLGGALALLFPIQWNEPFGIVMAESLASGTPVIAWKRASTPEVIRHGITGFLCESEDEMVAAIEQVNQLDRAACRADAEKRFSANVMVQQYLGLIEKVCVV